MTAASQSQSQSQSGTNRADVWFISHGGPPSLYEYDFAGYKAWQTMGESVKLDAEEGKLKGLVIVSAHWESDHISQDRNRPAVSVNVNPVNEMIYDFYGFPKHFYSETFKSGKPAQMVEKVKEALIAGGLQVIDEDRGLDHGAWIPLKAAFGEGTDIPIVQVSLPGNSSPISTARLGKALAALRDDGYTVLASGQAVHNIRDLVMGRPAPYTPTFLKAVSAAYHSSSPTDEIIKLFQHPLFRSAHPSDEHFLPLVVAAAARDEGDTMEEVLLTPERGGWGTWKWTAKGKD